MKRLDGKINLNNHSFPRSYSTDTGSSNDSELAGVVNTPIFHYISWYCVRTEDEGLITSNNRGRTKIDKKYCVAAQERWQKLTG